jgi:hypothetical protein
VFSGLESILNQILKLWHQYAYSVFALHFDESIRPLNIYSVETAVLWNIFFRLVHVFIGNIDFAKSRQDWFQQFVFVLYNNEEARGVAEQLDAAPERRLCIDREFVRVVHHDTLEEVVFVALDVRFCELFQFVSDKLDSLAVCAVYKHYIVLDSCSVRLVDSVDKVADDGSLTAARGAVEHDIGDFADVDKIIEL